MIKLSVRSFLNFVLVRSVRQQISFSDLAHDLVTVQVAESAQFDDLPMRVEMSGNPILCNSRFGAGLQGTKRPRKHQPPKGAKPPQDEWLVAHCHRQMETK
jgi:hypothetical protein